MIFQLDNSIAFPHPKYAEPDGLLAVGGDLSSERLMLAYENGIFPWYSDETPILWYSPHERFVLFPQELRISKSMKQVIKSGQFQTTIDQAFEQVIEACASIGRNDQNGTWITVEMQKAYLQLHSEGAAHSIEVWQNNLLVGGLYGVKIGKVFCGESMFSKVSNASKLALITLAQQFDFRVIDCQVHTEHLESMGAKMIDRESYMEYLTP